MSYLGISIQEVISKINAPVNGWFLPQVQRQYVWGARYESESYICLLLDSLLKQYPIGGIVVWETNQAVPYREFIKDYIPGKFALEVDRGRWGVPKALVYDGQQRLQTLYSVLHYRFNGRVLHFDLLFDSNSAESDENGFLFRDPGEPNDPRYLRMTYLCSRSSNEEQKIALEDSAVSAAQGDPQKRLLIRKNISALWTVFVEASCKSIAYFPVKANSPKEVNEVFRRLNTGGVSLTQLELVLSKIKAVYSDYEQRLWELAESIEAHSGGIRFSSTSILQYFYLLICQTIRIDEARIGTSEIERFEKALHEEREVLHEFFSGYLKELFNINHASIIPRWSACLPLLTYLSSRKQNRADWRIKKIGQPNLVKMHQYFLLSQFCDWNTQTMVNTFARQAIAAGAAGEDFPIEKIRETALQKNRTGYIHEYQLRSLPLLATKVILPKRLHTFHENKPQIDHIFPLSLKGTEVTYASEVDVLWNLQPISASVNNYKRARHPKEFFASADGSKYRDSYDWIPEPDSELWADHQAFLEARKTSFLETLQNQYDLIVITEGPGL